MSYIGTNQIHYLDHDAAEVKLEGLILIQHIKQKEYYAALTDGVS